MKPIRKKSETKTISEHPGSLFTEYSLPFTSLAVGVSEIHGRYPENNYDIDTDIEQVWYVENGEGKIWLQGKEYTVEPGDMIHVKKNEKYWIIGNHLKLIVSSSPPWYPQQHKHSE